MLNIKNQYGFWQLSAKTEKKNFMAACGLKAGRIVSRYAHTAELSNPGLNPDPTINHHSGIKQAEQFINVCAIP